jgi:hypothetical protein
MPDILTGLVALLKGRVFEIRLSDGRASVAKGKAPRGFVEDCEAVARDAGLEGGSVWGTGSAKNVSLMFSSGIPDDVRQRLRNAWQFAKR